MKKFPPLNSLRVFEVVVRHNSFTKAATELLLTQGAVSKQVKLLEEYLGIKLFERKHQHIDITAAGQAYIEIIRPALIAIAEGTNKFLKIPNKSVTLQLNILPSLTSRWLIPLLDELKTQYPNLNVSLAIGQDAVDFEESQADIAIRVARKNIWKHCVVEKFMEEKVIPICSPFLKHHVLIHTPNDLMNCRLLQHTSRPTMWEEYFKALGCKDIKEHTGVSFEHFFMLIKAAEEGLGIALVPSFLVESELKSGSLVQVLEADFRSPYAYYLIYPKYKARLMRVRNFRKWIQGKYPVFLK